MSAPRVIYLLSPYPFPVDFGNGAWSYGKNTPTDIAYILKSDYDELQAKLTEQLPLPLDRQQLLSDVENIIDCNSDIDGVKERLTNFVLTSQDRIDWLEGELSQFGQQGLDLERVQAKLTKAERLNKVALEAMKELEWCETEYDPAHGHSSSCPSCGGASKEGDLRHPNQEYGHYDDCPIANAIKEIEKGTA